MVVGHLHVDDACTRGDTRSLAHGLPAIENCRESTTTTRDVDIRAPENFGESTARPRESDRHPHTAACSKNRADVTLDLRSRVHRILNKNAHGRPFNWEETRCQFEGGCATL